MGYAIAFLLGAALVFCIYHFNLQPALRKERDALVQKLKDKTGV